MGAIGLGNGEVWGGSGAAVLMVLRAALPHATDDVAREHLERAIAMNGLGLSLDAVEDERSRVSLRQALRAAATDVRTHALQLAELAEELDSRLSQSDHPG